jgi:hypothetical protein
MHDIIFALLHRKAQKQYIDSDKKDKIKATQESAEKAIENEMRKVRKTARSAKFNKMKGKAAIGLGIGTAALGAYKLGKQIKKERND